MSLILRREQVSVQLEKRIVMGMIVSKKVLRELQPQFDREFFKNTYTKEVASWCIDYYESYEAAPKAHIKDSYIQKREKLRDGDAEMIETLLSEMSDNYVLKDGINDDRIIDQALDYFQTKELEIIHNNIGVLLKEGNIKEAQDQVINYRKFSRLSSDWESPFDEKAQARVFEEKDGEFLKLPGALGELIGPLERSWLVGIMGPFKRGKTFFAFEFAVMGALSGLKSAIISLEMKASQIDKRIYQRFIPSKGSGGKFLYPIFDCKFNQLDSCEIPNRTNNVRLIDDMGRVPPFRHVPDYSPCTYCRHNDIRNYIPAIWYEEGEYPAFDNYEIGSRLDAMSRNFSHLIKRKVYPRFSASLTDINRDLDLLEYQGFVPEILVLDYPDILRPEGNEEGIEKEDAVWKNMARMAAERNLLLIAPTQVTREGMDAANVKEKHMSKWIGKLGHVDAMLTLNQTEKEEEKGVIRIALVDHRHRECNKRKKVMVLQNRSIGQVHLDSELWVTARKENSNAKE